LSTLKATASHRVRWTTCSQRSVCFSLLQGHSLVEITLESECEVFPFVTFNQGRVVHAAGHLHVAD